MKPATPKGRVLAASLLEAGGHLGLALANLVNTVDVRYVVLGGDLAVLADHLLSSLRKTFFANVLQTVGAEVRFLVSVLGKDAVARGGVALALEGFLPLPISGRLAHLTSPNEV